MKTVGKHTVKRTRKTQGAHSLRSSNAQSAPTSPFVLRAIGLVCSLALLSATPLAAWAAQDQQTASKASEQSSLVQEAAYVSPRVGTGPAKDEVVYAKLDASGATQGVYVVNSFASDAAENVSDPANYSKVTNLSTTDKLAVSDGAVSFSKQAGTFYYQGDLAATTDLPWRISIAYSLDGQQIAPADLGGKSGQLAITMHIAPNTNVDAVFADNYLLQVSGSFPAANTMNIEAEGATIADSGSDKLVNYMLLPGQEKTYILSAAVTDFDFAGFQISAVPLSLTLDVDSFDTSSMSSEMDTLKNSIAQLADGTKSVSGGAKEIGDALKVFASEGERLDAGSSQLVEGSAGVLAGLKQGIKEAQDNQVSAQSQLDAAKAALFSEEMSSPGSLAVAGGGLMAAQAGLTDSKNALTDASTALGQLQPGDTLTAADIAELYNALTAAGQGLQSAGDGLAAVDLSDIGNKAGTLATVSGQLGGYTGAATALSSVKGQGSATDPGFVAFDAGLRDFAGGVDAYTGGAASLATQYGVFQDAVCTLADGTTQLRDATSNLDQQLLDRVREEINNYMDYSFPPRSFVVSSNTNVNQVQFVFMSEAITAPEEQAPLPEEQPMGFLDRISALFK